MGLVFIVKEKICYMGESLIYESVVLNNLVFVRRISVLVVI